jgi:hypothetical protein
MQVTKVLKLSTPQWEGCIGNPSLPGCIAKLASGTSPLNHICACHAMHLLT